MYKLVIVDDEPMVRNGLRSYINWSSHGIEVAGEAEDGAMALEVIEQVRPELVLTDVRMPHMDGLELANVLSEKAPHIKVIFISGHEDAEYLKSALKLQAVDYLFKPVKRPELITVIGRTVEALRTEERERRQVREMQVKLQQSMPLLREKFLLSLIRDGVTFPATWNESAEFLGLELPLEAPYWVLSITLDNVEQEMGKRTERDRQLLSYSVHNIVQELIDQAFGGYAFELRTGEYVGILRLREEACPSAAGEQTDTQLPSDGGQEERLLQLAERIRDSLHRFLKISVTIGVGERTSRLEHVPQSYSQARQAAELRWFLGKNRVISMDNLMQGEDSFDQSEPAGLERIGTLLKAADPAALQAELMALFNGLKRSRREGISYGRLVSLQLLLMAERLLLELHIQGEKPGGVEPLSMALRQETLQDLQQLVESTLIGACRRIGEKRSGRSSNVIERVNKLMEERYAENLQLADLAKEVYLSVTYLCMFYKQETGETINEALTKVRVEKAKELLKDPGYKFYEVCFAVGYQDPSYFSKIFKRYTGVSPSAYRERPF